MMILFLLIYVFQSFLVVLSDSEAESRWRTDGHQYNLRDKLVFGQGGQRRVSGSVKHNPRQFGQFQGGERGHICTLL